MKKINLIIYSCICLISCTDGDITQKLTDGKNKYWDVVEMTNLYSKSHSDFYPFYCYSFKSNGSMDFFYYENEKRLVYNAGDIEIPKRWKYVSEDSILIGNLKAKIDKLTNDTFIFSSREMRVVLAASK